MAAKTSWHRYETKLRRWYPLYKQCAVIIFFSPRRMHRAQRCGLLLPMFRGLCVFLSVCWTQTCALPKRQNRSRYRVGRCLVWAERTMGLESPLPTEGAFLGEAPARCDLPSKFFDRLLTLSVFDWWLDDGFTRVLWPLNIFCPSAPQS